MSLGATRLNEGSLVNFTIEHSPVQLLHCNPLIKLQESLGTTRLNEGSLVNFTIEHSPVQLFTLQPTHQAARV